MNTYNANISNTTSRSNAESVAKVDSSDKSVFVKDNPLEAIKQLEIKQLADNSPQVKQLMAYQQMANASSAQKNVPGRSPVPGNPASMPAPVSMPTVQRVKIDVGKEYKGEVDTDDMDSVQKFIDSEINNGRRENIRKLVRQVEEQDSDRLSEISNMIQVAEQRYVQQLLGGGSPAEGSAEGSGSGSGSGAAKASVAGGAGVGVGSVGFASAKSAAGDGGAAASASATVYDDDATAGTMTSGGAKASVGGGAGYGVGYGAGSASASAKSKAVMSAAAVSAAAAASGSAGDDDDGVEEHNMDSAPAKASVAGGAGSSSAAAAAASASGASAAGSVPAHVGYPINSKEIGKILKRSGMEEVTEDEITTLAAWVPKGNKKMFDAFTADTDALNAQQALEALGCTATDLIAWKIKNEGDFVDCAKSMRQFRELSQKAAAAASGAGKKSSAAVAKNTLRRVKAYWEKQGKTTADSKSGGGMLLLMDLTFSVGGKPITAHISLPPDESVKDGTFSEGHLKIESGPFLNQYFFTVSASGTVAKIANSPTVPTQKPGNWSDLDGSVWATVLKHIKTVAFGDLDAEE